MAMCIEKIIEKRGWLNHHQKHWVHSLDSVLPTQKFLNKSDKLGKSYAWKKKLLHCTQYDRTF